MSLSIIMADLQVFFAFHMRCRINVVADVAYAMGLALQKACALTWLSIFQKSSHMTQHLFFVSFKEFRKIFINSRYYNLSRKISKSYFSLHTKHFIRLLLLQNAQSRIESRDCTRAAQSGGPYPLLSRNLIDVLQQINTLLHENVISAL